MYDAMTVPSGAMLFYSLRFKIDVVLQRGIVEIFKRNVSAQYTLCLPVSKLGKDKDCDYPTCFYRDPVPNGRKLQVLRNRVIFTLARRQRRCQNANLLQSALGSHVQSVVCATKTAIQNEFTELL